MAETTPPPQEDFWLFGYGSIPNLETTTSLREDHRGTPTHPGRVVTLIAQPHYLSLLSPSSPPPPTSNQNTTTRVWGAAYHIPTHHIQTVQSYLSIREINGYSIHYTPFYPFYPSNPTENKTIEKCMVYIGLPTNPQFLGVQDGDALARRIWSCRGPSGENREYLFMLEEALKELGEGAGDEHVEELARRVREVGMERGEDRGDGGGWAEN
ncbi:MAG: hypothetical protein Q9186_001525 [Xanthomendoza sp. 1 TL-2023]